MSFLPNHFQLYIFTALSRLRTITLSHKICHCQYFKSTKFFCVFGLKIIILSPYELLTEIFPAPYTTFYVPIKFPLGKKVRLWCNSANFWSKYGFFFFFLFGSRFIKMVRLKMETNTFCSRRIYVQGKGGFDCNNYRQKFPSSNFLWHLFFLM